MSHSRSSRVSRFVTQRKRLCRQRTPKPRDELDLATTIEHDDFLMPLHTLGVPGHGGLFGVNHDLSINDFASARKLSPESLSPPSPYTHANGQLANGMMGFPGSMNVYPSSPQESRSDADTIRHPAAPRARARAAVPPRADRARDGPRTRPAERARLRAVPGSVAHAHRRA